MQLKRLLSRVRFKYRPRPGQLIENDMRFRSELSVTTVTKPDRSYIWQTWVDRRQIRGKRACLYSVVDLVNQLDAEKRAGRAGHLANRLLNQDAIVLDELGYSPFSADGGVLLFHLISKLYERVSLITTNLRRMERRVRRRQDDHRLARSTHASMRNHRDRQRQLSLQETSMRAKYEKTGDRRSRGTPRSPLSNLHVRSEF